jgi:hypothetical protein
VKKGYELGGKYSADPIGSDAPKGKSCAQRKASKDGPTLTGSEQRLKNELMRQFMRTGEGPGGVSAAFRDNYDAIDWTQ